MRNKERNFLLLTILALFIFPSCGDDNDENEPSPKPLSTEKRITSFSFDGVKNGLPATMKGVFNSDSTTITFTTKTWIDKIDQLIPDFEAKGTVKVASTIQTSGTTTNDFRKETVYTAVAEDGSNRDYTVLFKSPQASGLPVLKIDVDGGKEITSKENYLTADIKVSDVKDDNNSFVTRTEIRGRGNTTWGYVKKPYRLKFLEKTSLFGLPAEKSWVLLANYLDPTLIMNTVAFELGHRFGLPYTNHYNHVELYLNGEYKGSYMLTEQVQVKKSRVNVNEKTGFLVELDTYYDEEPKFSSNILRLPVMIKSPEDLTDPAGYDFVKDAVNGLEEALFGATFPNGYQDLIDVNTFIDFMLVNDIIRNTELMHPKSMYMYKDTDSKIGMGPLWDFDWAFGYSGGGHVYYTNPKEMLLKPNYTGGFTGYTFFCRFLDDPDFRTKYKARWNELYASKIATMDIFIDEMATQLEKSQTENFEVWNNRLNYKEQITKMKSWLKERTEYMNTEINKY